MLERGVRWKMDSREKAREEEEEASALLGVGERKGKLICRRAGEKDLLKVLVARAGEGIEGSLKLCYLLRAERERKLILTCGTASSRATVTLAGMSSSFTKS